MANVLKAKGLLWPVLMTLFGVAILIALGTWQLQRLAWKQGLIADIAARAHGDPISLARAQALERDGKNTEYLRVNAEGRFLHDKERHLYAFDAQFGPGYHVVTPLRLTDGSVVLVNRGYVPLDLKEPGKRAKGQVLDDVQIVGLVRGPGKPGPFTPANDVEKNIWYWRDLDAMTASAFGEDKPQTLPFVIDAEAEPRPPGGWPKGGVTRLDLPNRHLAYALTWYGLALALLAVFVAYAAPRLRRPAP